MKHSTSQVLSRTTDHGHGLDVATVRYRLSLAGYSLTDLAREMDVTISAISQVISNSDPSARIAARIAHIIDIPANEIWPGRYPQLQSKEETQ